MNGRPRIPCMREKCGNSEARPKSKSSSNRDAVIFSRFLIFGRFNFEDMTIFCTEVGGLTR